MADTIYFNTGRCYTKAGQRITATRHDDGIITFMDHDRMIPGELPWGRAFSAVSVLAAYDACDYVNSSRAMTDGMQRGGCNTAADKPAPAPAPAPAPIPTQPAAEGPASPTLAAGPRRGDRVQVRTAFGHGPVMMVTVLGLGEKNGRPLVDYETDNGERRWAYLDQLVAPKASNERLLGDMLFKILQHTKRPRDGGMTQVPSELLDEASEVLASTGR